MGIGKEGVFSNTSVPAAILPRAPPHHAVSIFAESFQINITVTVSTILNNIEKVLVDHPDDEVDGTISQTFDCLQRIFHTRSHNDVNCENSVEEVIGEYFREE